jgi:hypothetical protein
MRASAAVQPLLVATEVLRASVAEQNRVIGDLNALIRRLRQKNPGLPTDHGALI